MSEIWYQLSPNLFLDGNKVFSYTTHVAEIKEDKLEVFGKYHVQHRSTSTMSQKYLVYL